jgi:hypothetical protein
MRISERTIKDWNECEKEGTLLEEWIYFLGRITNNGKRLSEKNYIGLQKRRIPSCRIGKEISFFGKIIPPEPE